ncbi:Toxin VapC4 [Desulfuromonas sp. DDH964]|uniref:type II toxin-antitoxin system VapC family toxin n=1 Tax=Desulfuromonas sp. DDH964 TaxID=1823759 RepID=UPI00078B664E|nr:type II toxin-antitoxin system VapC family toxin [Desulfuromonas sp. DDH964]AMV73354.1 Toxin VapC4 [Desulfuromonas sp. DDH964]
MGFLIDTCIWIDVEQGTLTPADIANLTGNEPVYLSPVTIAELTFGAEIASDPGVRQKRLAALRRLQRKPLLTIDAGTAITFGSLAATIQLQGKKPRGRIQDLWLASQAIQQGHTLLTRNKRDFEDIPGLDLASI